MTTDTKPQTPLMVRGVDMELWRRLRGIGVQRGLTAGATFNEAVRIALERLEQAATPAT